jgi:hypothetical protein
MPPLPKPPSENDSDAPITGVVLVELMTGDDDKDTALLRGMSQDAEAYLRSFCWCKDVPAAKKRTPPCSCSTFALPDPTWVRGFG